MLTEMVTLAFVAVSSGHARAADHDRAEAQTLDLAKQAIALRSVQGAGNQTPQVAALFKSAPVAGGCDDVDVTITSVDEQPFSSLAGRASIPSSSRS